MNEKWPCPCCGHLILAEGPGDYELCPVCFWEDDGTQLRWPLSDDGANGISLIEAQRNFRRYGAASKQERGMVRRPNANEPLEEGWRPIDLARDNIERDPDSPDRRPWPADPTRLYWWRPNYYGSADASEAAIPEVDDRVRSPAERLMARVLEAVPEAREIDRQMRREYEAPNPFHFCSRLTELVFSAYESGNAALADRVITVLDTGLTDGDAWAHDCVSIAFLEDERWQVPEMESFIALWPSEIRAEITGRHERIAAAKAEAAQYANPWATIRDALTELGSTHRGRPIHEAVRELRTTLAAAHLDLPDDTLVELAAMTLQLGWSYRHPLRWFRTRRLRHLRFVG